jgi:restriction system protein
MDGPWWWWLAAAGALVLLVVLAAAWGRGAARKAVRLAVEEHAPALARRRAQLIRVDDYGVEIDKAWRKEMDHFFDRVVLPRLGPGRERWALERRDEILGLIDATARDRPAPPARSAAASGADFEVECRAILEERGWSARRTGAAGDQGADILAEKDGLSVAIQCKHLARPVGNKAVQEVAAARTYYGVDAAAVVATGDYTEAARRLAARNDVLLLHVDDLGNLEDRLGEAAPRGRAPERG